MRPRQPEENRSGGSRGQPVVVLDADQSYAVRRARRRFLAAAEFCVHQVPGASRALEAATTHKPDVILLNADSPDLEAAEICRSLKAGPGKVPVVVLLISPAKARIDLPRCGADLCLPRNLAPAFLIEALRTLLRLRSAEREIHRSRGELADFSMQLAHDIEGPLRGVVTFAELIGQAHPLSESERTYLGHVLSSADQVRRLARCVLTYAQAKRELPGLTVVPLHAAVAAAVHALRARIKESMACVDIQDPLPSALGDFSALQQVIQCLVGNAINYRGANGSLSITIGARQGSGGECLIFVSDNGIGVAKEHHESIFAPFKRLHGSEIPGAGLGLAICKHIVEAHGGRIWVESEPGRGASFLFTLRAPA
jgi:signal transduction histidine kinase